MRRLYSSVLSIVLSFGLPLLLTVAFLSPTGADAQSFVFNLTGGQEVPRVFTQASGTCSAVLREDEEGGDETLELIVACNHDAEDPVAAHIHLGTAGENGPIVYTFEDPEDVDGLFDISVDHAAALLTEGLYVNVHTDAHPNGEVRGQMRFQAVDVQNAVIFPLEGSQVVPPVTTAAEGRCLATLYTEGFGGELFLICRHTVMDPIAAHIHQGPPGTDSPIVLDLGTGESPIILDDEPISQGLTNAFLEGNLYVQVHSASHPAGELRGQIQGCLEGRSALCLNRGRFRVEVDWREFQGTTGQGRAVRQGADSGTFWFFDPDNTEMILKILDACAPPFNRYWVFLAATTNVEFTVTVTDTLHGASRTYTNPLGQAAAPILDTDAFATCP
jgi:hypothetical protein